MWDCDRSVHVPAFPRVIDECESSAFRAEEMVISNLLKVRVTLISDIRGNVPAKNVLQGEG